MVDILLIPPVPDIPLLIHLFDDHFFLGPTQGQDQKDFIISGKAQGVPQTIPVDRGDYTAAVPGFHRS
jgi:hypothetical protein